MCVWYLRNTYLENKLTTPNVLTVCNEKIDLSRFDLLTSTFIYGFTMALEVATKGRGSTPCRRAISARTW